MAQPDDSHEDNIEAPRREWLYIRQSLTALLTPSVGPPKSTKRPASGSPNDDSPKDDASKSPPNDDSPQDDVSKGPPAKKAKKSKGKVAVLSADKALSSDHNDDDATGSSKVITPQKGNPEASEDRGSSTSKRTTPKGALSMANSSKRTTPVGAPSMVDSSKPTTPDHPASTANTSKPPPLTFDEKAEYDSLPNPAAKGKWTAARNKKFRAQQAAATTPTASGSGSADLTAMPQAHPTPSRSTRPRARGSRS